MGTLRRSRSGSRGERHVRRRHRRRRDGSGSRGSRAGTPLRDEPDAPPTEPRRPPRERPPLPMSLPLPKFAVQLLRAAPAAPRQAPAPAPAPDSPPRPPSVSSSSGGSAPHSPSLEERIRSLDEKYEKWSGSRALADAPDRSRLRHRLLEVDINEVKPSEVVRSLLAKRSVFDEDSERLEGAVRAPSPAGSPRARAPAPAPRVLRYPFPSHAPPPPDADDAPDRAADPRLGRLVADRLKFAEIDRFESRVRARTPSTDVSQLDSIDRISPRANPEPLEIDKTPIERRRRDSLFGSRSSSDISAEIEPAAGSDAADLEHRCREKSVPPVPERRQSIGGCQEPIEEKPVPVTSLERKDMFKPNAEDKQPDAPLVGLSEDKPRESAESLLKRIGNVQEILKTDSFIERRTKSTDEYSKSDLPAHIHEEIKSNLENEVKLETFVSQIKNECEKSLEIFTPNHVKKEFVELESQLSHLNAHNLVKINKDVPELSQELIKNSEKNGKDRYSQNMMLEVMHMTKLEKENIEFDKCFENDKFGSSMHFLGEKKVLDSEKVIDDRVKGEKSRHSKDRHEKEKQDCEKDKAKSNNKHERSTDKSEKEKRTKEECTEKAHGDKSDKNRDSEKSYKERSDRESEKTKHSEEKSSRHDHHRKDKLDKDKRKDSVDSDIRAKKEEKPKHNKSRKESSESKRDSKKESESVKSRKTSRDETSRDIYRKDSTDSSTSRASHDSSKLKDLDSNEIKEEPKSKKHHSDMNCKLEPEKESTSKCLDIIKFEPIVKIKIEVKDSKDLIEQHVKSKNDNTSEHSIKNKGDITEKQRHYSLDSPSVDSKRKERLNSCSSLPSNIGHKRRMSSQDSLEYMTDDLKKSKNSDAKSCLDRRDSKDSRNTDRHKTTKFNKCHFAKLIESKTKEDKKNLVKPPEDTFEPKENEHKDEKHCSDKQKLLKNSPTIVDDEQFIPESQSEGLHNDIDFLATLELRSSEEDEKQKALRKEMKEKKRIQQLQQIQELQMQQDALQQAELMNKDKKLKTDEKKKDAARDKRMSTDRKSRDEKSDSNKRKSRKPAPSTDSSDSDEPKKHSIFDIIDDGPTYISMYDKVKARSCKNMQKQEEEKRQEKIKAKFSQLKQSRAKREEKKRSSWDEDSDSDHERKKTQKSSMDSSTDEDNMMHNKKREKVHASTSLDFDRCKVNDYFHEPSNEEDSRNKLSRKNSRTRIMSDTSDDEMSKRSISKSPNFINESKKESTSDSESLHRPKDHGNLLSKESSEDRVKKNSLLNLFGKSDSDDSKIKSGLETDTEYKPSFIKSIPNDFSSESESAMCSRNTGEVRKKHRKKQKRHKSLLSDVENKCNNDSVSHEGDGKHKISEKVRRHSTKKEKRKEKNRESIDTDELRDDRNKSKGDKKITNCCFDAVSDNISKKDGKMEDIFGPLSDESDRETRANNKLEFTSHTFESTFNSVNDQNNTTNNCDDGNFKEKDDNKRKKDKKRKDKRFFVREDDNSLDVDAVSKAIEARLFAESITDDENRSGLDTIPEYPNKNEQNELKKINDDIVDKANDKHSDKAKKECREKRKKKKRNREDRQSRKEHHHFHHHDKTEKTEVINEQQEPEMSSKDMLLDIPLPSDIPTANLSEKSDDNKSLSESPSLPRLIDSPPVITQSSTDSEPKVSGNESPNNSSVDISMEIDYPETKQVEVDDIPMPPSIENIDISEVPLPDGPPMEPQPKGEAFVSAFDEVKDIDKSECAVRSISNLTQEAEKQAEKVETVEIPNKIDKKVEEKPRAIISQEETEDAVAALLGESFGGKVNSFSDCYEQVENDVTSQTEIETTSIETEIIPEEDAEEMRQAVQNLNASEMELKPDTPVSDNDLLLIDTDTEEADETPQEAIERLPLNVIATSQPVSVSSDPTKPTVLSNIVISKPKPATVEVTSEASAINVKASEPDIKIQLAKRESPQQITSTATPVITSWTLANNKLIEPHVLNIQTSPLANRDKNENKPTHITANIVQIKAPHSQNLQVNNTLRPIFTPARVSAPYQVINQIIRPQTSNMQPPTIKIPEPHILYQKPSGIVISPRMSNDPRMQSPKATSQGEGMTSPRLSNMAILSSSSQNLNSVGIASPNALQQRSPGQVTVVRMQQPPLSPIQAMHLPHGARTMLSPNRPNSVLVQTQGAPIPFNRLPITPVLAPISKQISVNNVVHHNKGITVSTSPLIHQPKVITEEKRKSDQRNIADNMNDSSKIILSPTSLPQNTNPTVMAQNRLISMQHAAVHVSNMNSALQLGNKVLINNLNHLNEKRENSVQKSEQLIPFGATPIIHVAGVNNSSASIIQSVNKPVMCTLQEANTISRTHGSNVIHTLNSQRLLTTAPLTNVIQLDKNKGSSVLSMATLRPPTVLTKLDTSSKSVAATTTCLTNVVMTPLLLKTTKAPGAVMLNPKSETEPVENHGKAPLLNHLPKESEVKREEKDETGKVPSFTFDVVDKPKEYFKPSKSPIETIAKCETDFEELLKDTTNEIKVTNDPEKKLEVNVGKTLTLISPKNRERKPSTELLKKEDIEKNMPTASEHSVVEPVFKNQNTNILVNQNSVPFSSQNTTSLSSQKSTPIQSQNEDLNKVQSIQLDKENKETLSTDDTLANTTENKSNNESSIKEVSNNDIPLAVISNKIINEPEKFPDFGSPLKIKDDTFFTLLTKSNDSCDSQLKGLDENDSWSAKDVNIDSVIKKVDSLCNETNEVTENKEENINNESNNKNIIEKSPDSIPLEEETKSIDVQFETVIETSNNDEIPNLGKASAPSKRGGRSVRGKKSEKNQDRVQTRQISKPTRGGSTAKRGRGRAKVDKKLKNLVNNSTNNIPGDVYDFHEDSGDETTSNKTEARPRLILTIKSPLSGHCATSTSSLIVTPKDQPKVPEKINKEEKPDDFASPLLNTRKSRRLQEKDVQKSTVDETMDDFVRSPAAQTKGGKRKPARQVGAKTGQADTRKSPRGVKRTRDRSLSDASMDSGDEKALRNETSREAKAPRLTEPIAASPAKTEPEIPPPSLKSTPPPVPVQATPAGPAPTPTPTPTPIMKPPKKMISEISAKLAGAFDSATVTPVRPVVSQAGPFAPPLESSAEKPTIREPAQAAPAVPDAEFRAEPPGDVYRRLVDNVPGNMNPVGATEASDARVQSPALPHRPPSSHRVADRATPVLMR